MTKADEIATFKKFYDKLPQDSYLKGILKGMDAYIENQLQMDFAIPVVEYEDLKHQYYQEAEDAKRELEKARAEVDRVQDNYNRKVQDCKRLYQELEDLRREHCEMVDAISKMKRVFKMVG
ncbi:MAG: hypothetical protein C4570_07855 [Ammonifex sp.]|jgi:chromosome segregation ATPase|nr:MAG: hypothetical protein C4570_07855 [Ammonifex sp.]